MAKKVTVTLVDDFDGEGAADETVEFGLDGVTYEIDLSNKNAGKLRADGVGKTDMRHHAAAEECGDAATRAVEKLVGNDEIERRVLFLHGTHGA